jgi:aminomethyltransferase
VFFGKEALEGQIQGGDYSRIVGVVMSGRVPAREGYMVWHEGRLVGSIRSGSIAPSVDNKNIATALVEKAAATEGARLEVEIRGTKHEATVVPLPFYKRAK